MYNITGNISGSFPNIRKYIVSGQDNNTAILRNFSRSNNNSEWEISINNRFPRGEFFALFYANGNCKDNEGYVSVIFSNNDHDFYLFHPFYKEMRFYVSVVDVAGNKRFTQSFVCARSMLSQEDYQFGLERYLKRDTLLNDPAELLPEDCLTICVDINKTEGPQPWDVNNCDDFIIRDTDRDFVALDTDFGRYLCSVSEVFRRASDVPMMESRTRKVRIEEGEQFYFLDIQQIFDTYELPHLSMEHLCELYRVADKYDIQPIIETCREFVKALLLTADHPKFRKIETQIVRQISKLSENYRDDDLKETLQTYLESKENLETNYDELGKHLKVKFNTEWKCELYVYKSDYSFDMRKRIIEPEFQFYQ